MGSRFGGIPVDDTQSSAPAISKFGGVPVDDKPGPGPAGHAPTWRDDVSDSVNFLGNEIKGVGTGLNPINIATGVAHTVAHPIDTAKQLIHLPGQLYDQYQSGDMSGLAQNIGQIAGNVIAGKGLAELPKLPSAVSNAVKSPAGKAIGAGAKAVLPEAIKSIPIVGKTVAGTAAKMTEAYQTAQATKIAAAAEAARNARIAASKSRVSIANGIKPTLTPPPAEVQPIAPNVLTRRSMTPAGPPPPVPIPRNAPAWQGNGINGQLPPPPEAVQPIAPNIPTRRATAPANPPPVVPGTRVPAWQQAGSTGERPPTPAVVEPIAPAPYVAPPGRGLSPGILDSIAQWKTGKNFNQLTPDEVKVVTDLAAKVKPQPQTSPTTAPTTPTTPTTLPPPPGTPVKGLQSGQMAVKQHQVLSNVDQAIENKVANIHDYLSKNGIRAETLDAMTPQQLNDLAKAAHEHGQKVGNAVPKSGYKGLEGDSLQMVKDRLRQSQSQQLAPPPATSLPAPSS